MIITSWWILMHLTKIIQLRTRPNSFNTFDSCKWLFKRFFTALPEWSACTCSKVFFLVHIWKWPLLFHAFLIFPYQFLLIIYTCTIHQVLWMLNKLNYVLSNIVCIGREDSISLIITCVWSLLLNYELIKFIINICIVFRYCWICFCPEYVWNIYHWTLNNQSIDYIWK